MRSATLNRILAVSTALLASGCYTERLTHNWRNLPTAEDLAKEDAIIEESGQDEESAKRIEARLKELSTPADTPYKMNSGDQIAIQVYGHEDLSTVTRLGPDGRVGFAFMGQVMLKDLTPGEGAEAIRAGLEPYVKNPVVSITICSVDGETATIGGACFKAGVFPISNSTRLADLYAMAGSSSIRLFNGVDVDVADLEHSILVREGEILPVNFRRAIEQGDPLHNIPLHKGDYAFIAQRMESSVTICGEVANPHKRLYEAGMGLVETLAAAGWMAESHWKHVIIIRDGLSNPKMFKVDIDGILSGRCRNIQLKANDIVYVPRDDLAEYNVFVRKLLPTAQLFNLAKVRGTARWRADWDE